MPKRKEMKTGFILHNDSLSVLDELTNEQAGILFKAIREYNQGKEPDLDFAMRMAFLPFKNQFERDIEKYNKTCEKNRNNGSKGGRPTKAKQTQKTQSVKSKPKKADNDNDNDKGNDKDTKEKKSIQKKNFEPPTLDEVKAWFIEQGSTAEAGAKAWQYYTDGNWIDSKVSH